MDALALGCGVIFVAGGVAGWVLHSYCGDILHSRIYVEFKEHPPWTR